MEKRYSTVSPNMVNPLRCLITIASFMAFFGCSTVTVDPIGYSTFYVFNSAETPQTVFIIYSSNYQNTKDIEEIDLGETDTSRIGEFCAFTTPTPSEVFDSIYLFQANSEEKTYLEIKDENWIRDDVKADYPQKYHWFLDLTQEITG